MGEYISYIFAEIGCFTGKDNSMISGSRFKDHTDRLFNNLGLIEFFGFDKDMIARFMLRYHSNDVLHIFEGCFPGISDIHDYGTRTKNDGLHAKHVKSENLYFIQRSTYVEHDYQHWHQYQCFSGNIYKYLKKYEWFIFNTNSYRSIKHCLFFRRCWIFNQGVVMSH